MTPKTGDIVFTKPKGLWGNLILIVSNFFDYIISGKRYKPLYYSHVLIMLTDKLTIEATGLRTKIQPFEKVYSRRGYKVYKLKYKANLEACLIGANGILSFHDNTYGFFQIFGMLMLFIGELFGKKMKNPISGGITCTELIYEYLKKIGYENKSINRDSLNIRQCMEYVENSEFFEVGNEIC